VGGGGPRVMYPHADGRLREYPEGGGIRGEVVYDAQGRATGLRRRRGGRKGKH
jgi:YD repeat-containing protein